MICLPEIFQKYVVRKSATLRQVMETIEINGEGFSFILDKRGRVIGVVTDGDIRRGILHGRDLRDDVTTVMTTQFIRVSSLMDRASVLDRMKSLSVRHVPVVDRQNRLVGIHFLHFLLDCEMKPNIAVIMCGGEGRRLRPFTEHIPKPMVSVAGRPMLERLVLHLVGFGIRRIFLAVNYRAKFIMDYFGNGDRFGCKIEYLQEKQALGTAGGLSLLRERPTTPLIVMNGDLVTQVNIGKMLKFHELKKAAATLAIRTYEIDVPFGVTVVKEGFLQTIQEKPVAHCQINAGIYVLDPHVLRFLEKGVPISMTTLLERLLRRHRRVAAYPIQEEWMDVGRRVELEFANGLRRA